jgi:hypothetical protein
MPRPRILLALALLCTLMFSVSTALADVVLLLPAKGQVPGSMLSSILDSETRYAIIEVGHQVVGKDDTDAALRSLSGGSADNADAYAACARVTRADWVVAPSVNSIERGYHLELTAFQVKGGRTEAVTRDIDTGRVHDQVVEMLRVLLRPEGVGTGALPWESGGVRPSLSAPTPQPSATNTTGPAPTSSARGPAADGQHTWLLLGAGIGFSSALSRPEHSAGSSTAAVGNLRAGVSPSESLELAVDFSGNLTGPNAKMLDVSARYLLAPSASMPLGIGPEIGAGVFWTSSGSQSSSFVARLSLVAGLRLSRSFSIEASLGDLRYVPASAGTLVLAGASAGGVLRF